ncbi:MAG: TPM domain-containing protein [Myxococcales bacterium]|nr:TPM domain-containing protein [Myxococcales bacterium]
MRRSLPCRFSAPSAMLALLVGASLALPATATANPGKVAQILQKSGDVGVVRGPGTISNDIKAKITGQAKQLAASTGGKVYVVIVNSETGIGPYSKLYNKLSMGTKDVLIASNGTKWALRCNGISKKDKKKLLKKAMTSGGDPLSRMSKLMAGIPAALGHSQAAAKPKTANQAARATGGGRAIAPVEESSGGYGWIFFLLIVGGGVGFVIWRRKQRDADLTGDLKAALDPAENHMADFYIGTDGFESHPQFSNMLAKGTALSNQIDTLKAAPPTRESISKAQTLAKSAAALESELRALK